MKNMKISKKLIVGFGTVIILLFILGIYAISTAISIDSKYSQLLDYPQRRLEILLRIDSKFITARRALSHMGVFAALEDASSNINTQREVINQAVKDINTELETYSNLLSNDKTLSANEKRDRIAAAANIRDLLTQWNTEVVGPVIQANLDGQRQEVIDISMKVASISNNLTNSISSLVELVETTSDNLNEECSSSAMTSVVVLGVIMVMITGIGMTFAIVITKSTVSALKTSVSQMENVSGIVASSARQLDSGSSQLAQGASEQAAGIEETSATMNETASMIKLTKDNTNQAADFSKKSEERTALSVEKVENLLQDVDDLNKSSKEIGKIVDAINAIALQINILALNASVEAARAGGESGRSFSVVAEEVRNLAQKSAEAVNSTAEIIEKNAQLMARVRGRASEVDEALDEIFGNVQKITSLLTGIASASEEQSRGIDQVNTAISQMEKVTQSSAAVAEETSATASEMLNSAELLIAVTADLSKLI